MTDFLENVFRGGSLPVIFLAVAFAGALAALSSCTIARLPVVWGFVAATAESRRKGFLLSMAFALGLIVSYTAIGFLLGAAADLTADLIQISKYLYFILGILLIAGGLFFAQLLPLGQGWINQRCQAGMKQAKTIPSAFVFGVLFAFLEMPACPCCGAVLMVIASLAMMKGSIMYSGFVFIAFAIGQSIPILIIGFSTSMLKNIVKRTEKLEKAISFIAGNILIVSGIFLIFLA